MKRYDFLIRWGLFIGLLFSPGAVMALTVDVDIDGDDVSGSGSSPVEVNIEGTTYTDPQGDKYKIEATNGSFDARVRGDDGGSTDLLALMNATITALDDDVDGTITFETTLNAGPNDVIFLDKTATGELLRLGGVWCKWYPQFCQEVGAVDSSITLDANYKHPTSNPFDDIEETTHAPTSESQTSINDGDPGNISDDMGTSEQRVLQGKITFHLDKAGDWIEFQEGAGLVITNSSSGGLDGKSHANCWRKVDPKNLKFWRMFGRTKRTKNEKGEVIKVERFGSPIYSLTCKKDPKPKPFLHFADRPKN